MDLPPRATDVVQAIPATTPFVGPETLERQLGFGFEFRIGANESLFGPSEEAKRAMVQEVERAQFYGDPEGHQLRTVIAAREKCGIENVILGSGIDDLLMLFARAFVAPGETVATTHGSYPTFEYAIQSVGGKFAYVPYRDNRVDLDSLGKTPAKLIYLANPDNPTGTWHSVNSVQQFRNSLAPDVLLLLDEAYSDFSPDLAPFDPDDQQTIRLRTFSKGHGMAGMRIGYALCHADHVRTLSKIRLHFGINRIALAGAYASYQDVGSVQSVVRQTQESRAWLAGSLAAEGYPSLPSETNFLCIDMGTEVLATATLLALREHRIFIRKPAVAPLDRFIRVTIGPLPVMEQFYRTFSG